MAVIRPVPRAEGISDKINDEVLFSSHSIIMDSGMTLQEEWDAHLRDMEDTLQAINSIKEFVGAKIGIPHQRSPLIFTKGVYQSPVFTNYNTQFMTISGQITGTNAGNYEVTFVLNDPVNNQWTDGTNGEQHVIWKIDPQALLSYPEQKTPIPEFTGDEIIPEWNNYDDTMIEIVGGTSENAFAGIHTTSFKPYRNYCWPDGTQDVKEIEWKISRKPVSLPVQVGVVYYTGKTRTPTWNNAKDSLFSVANGHETGIDAGTYEVWFKPTSNAMWDDTHTDEMRKTTWTISAAALAADVTGPNGKLTGITLEFDGSQKLPEFIGYDPLFMTATDVKINEHGDVIEDTTLTHRDVGSYATKFVPNNNSTWTDGFTTPIIIYWSITPMSVKVPYISYNGSTTNIEIPYKGSPVGPVKENYDSVWVGAEGSSGTDVNTEGYTAKFFLTESSNTVWEGGGTQPKTYSWKIIKKQIPIPTLTVSEVAYNNGLAVSPTISEYDTNFIKVSGNVAYNPGNDYEVIFELIDTNNTIWANGESKGQTVKWVVKKLTVDVPTVTDLSLEYDGTEKSPTIGTYDPAQISITGNKGTTVKTEGYTLKMHLIKTGSIWADTGDAEDKEYSWFITKKKIQIPVVSNYTNKEYNKTKQYVTVTGNDGIYDFSLNTEGSDPVDSYDRNYITINGISGTDAREGDSYYQVVMTLKDKNNSMWDTEEGSSNDITINWTIAKKVFVVPTVKGIYTYQENIEQVCEFFNYDPDTDSQWMTVTGNSSETTGPHTATFTLIDTQNTVWANGETKAQDIVWYINEIGINPQSLAIQNADVVYDGVLHTVSSSNISGFDSDIFELRGELTGTAANTYTAEVFLKNTTINKWSDATMASTDPVKLTWVISKRKMQIPTIKASKKSYFYKDTDITIEKTDCNFGNAKDKDFIVLSGNTGKNARNYTLRFSINNNHIASCRFDDGTEEGTTSYQEERWTINKAHIVSWSIETSEISITGAPGSHVDVAVIRPGNGMVNVSLNKKDIISYEVINGNSTNPLVRFADLNNTGSVNATISIAEGDNYRSSVDSNKQNPQTCKVSFACTVTIDTKRALKYYTPAEIVAKVRNGTAKDYWKVGDRIPITTQRAVITNGRTTLKEQHSNTITGGTYDAVVLGFDHNVSKETSSVSHNMAFALMFKNDEDQRLCFWLSSMTAQDLYDPNRQNAIYSSFENIFPEEWLNVMIPTRKSYSTHTNSGGPYYFNNKIFFLTPYEIYGTTSSFFSMNQNEVANGLQQQYDYFKNSSGRTNNQTVIQNVMAKVYGNISGYNQTYPVIVAGRTISTTEGQALITEDTTGLKLYSYCSSGTSTTLAWQQYAYNFVTYFSGDMTPQSSPRNRDKVYSNIGYGMIPCFTIG